MSRGRPAVIAAACELARLDQVRIVFPYRGAYRQLHREVDVGNVRGNQLILTRLDVTLVRQWLDRQGIDPDVGVPEGLGRTGLAAHQIDEKLGAEPTAEHHRLLGLAPAGARPPVIDGVFFESKLPGYRTMSCDESCAVEADWILMIENYETFVLLANAPDRLGRDGAGLIVFRSSPHLPYGMRWAVVIAAHNEIPLWHAPDVDPAGLSWTVGLGLAGVWVPTIESLDRLPANRALFDQQWRYVEQLEARVRERFPALLPWVEDVCARQAGFTQESAFAAGVPFTWVANIR